MSSLKNTMPNNRNTTDNRIEVTNRDRPKSPVSGNICPKLAYSKPISMKPLTNFARNVTVNNRTSFALFAPATM